MFGNLFDFTSFQSVFDSLTAFFTNLFSGFTL